MKEHGMSMDGTQVCYTRESLEHSPWADMKTDCKPTFTTRSSSTWKWHTSCPKSGYEGDGEANFIDPENYTVKSTSVSKIGGTDRASKTTITAKWQGADCGSVKPFDAKP
jgi:hypothetical protein